MAGYNLTRTVDELLVKTDTLPPSFTIHLHVEYWTLNNGPKFLYNSQVAVSLNFLCHHFILPTDLITPNFSRFWMIFARRGYR